MSKLQELIQQYCPDGVEFQTVDKIIADNFIKVITPKKKIQRNDYKNVGSVPIISQEIEYISGYCDENDDNIKKGIYICFGDHSEHIKYIDFAFVQGADGLKIMKMNSNQINPKYFYYAVCQFYNRKNNYERHFKYFRNTEIPVPPLEVQVEIVRILDKFSEVTKELQTKLEEELTARQKQYEYYSSKLFLDLDVPNIEMSELANFVYGYTDTAKDVGDTRFIRITDINEQGYLKNEDKKYITLTEEAQKSVLMKGDIIMARTGATFGKVLYFDSDFPSVYASFLIKIIPNEKLLSRYYWHFTKTPLYWEQANKLVTTGGQPQFNTPAVKKIKIPIPSIEEQNRIVSILDRFDSLCNDMKTGLPAEINARQKQYEYYRDKLLTFERRMNDEYTRNGY